MKENILFGTDGWRGIIAKDFTFSGVESCAEGVAKYHIAQNLHNQPLVIGYDTRFASKEFAEHAANTIARNNIKVLLCENATPTPVVSNAIVDFKASGGIIITASHNPYNWNGFKYRTSYGGSPDNNEIRTIENFINSESFSNNLENHSDANRNLQKQIEHINPFTPYFKKINALLKIEDIKNSKMNISVDSMHGAGSGYIKKIFKGGSIKINEIRSLLNPNFPNMYNPEPINHNLIPLKKSMSKHKSSVGLAFDGDADRLGIIDSNNNYVTTLQTFALLAYYLLEIRQLKGPIIKSLTTSNMMWKLGEKYGVEVIETPVGFKNIVPEMIQHDALIGGEESGGFAFKGHIPERDGIISGLFILDLMIKTKKSIPELIKNLFSIVGPHYFDRWDIPISNNDQSKTIEIAKNLNPKRLIGKNVIKTDHLDGVRFTLEDGSWVAMRFSGTEPLIRIYSETTNQNNLTMLLYECAKLLEIVD